MKKLLLLLIPAICFAQGTITPVNTTTPPASGYAPGAVIPINIVKSGNSACSATGTGCVTALQFDQQSMVGVATVAWTIAPALAASKFISCGPPNGTTCVIIGLNQTPIPDGPVAVATVTLASTLTLPSVTFGLFNTAVESDSTGASLAVSVTNPTLLLPAQKSRCAVASTNGTVGMADLQAVDAQITARTTNAATDLNSDTKTNVQDAQIVATAGSGGACNSK